jgi:hypothetical protein
MFRISWQSITVEKAPHRTMMLVSEMQVQKQVRKKAFTSLELILFQNQSFPLFDAKKNFSPVDISPVKECKRVKTVPSYYPRHNLGHGLGIRSIWKVLQLL